MMLKPLNWRVKKRDLSIAFLALGSSLIFSLLAYYFYHATQKAHTQHVRTLASWKTKYQQASDHLAIIQTLSEQFSTLEDRGIVGPENRLQLIETIQATATRLGIPEINYKISEQRLANSLYPDFDQSQLRLFQSHMSLDFRLLHEADLFAVLNDLEVYGKGLSHATQCAINQVTAFSTSEFEPNLVGHCKLTWYTLQPIEEGHDEKIN